MTTQTTQGEEYTAREIEQETIRFNLAEVDNNISDMMFKDRSKEILSEVFQ